MNDAEENGSKPSEGIQIRSYMMGQDVVFMVTGGTAHFGAAATAYVSDDRIISTAALSLPGHREEELAVELAKLAARVLNCTVAVLVGIHLEQPSLQDIISIVAEAITKMRQLLDKWSDGTGI